MKIFPQELEEQGKSLERFVWRQLGCIFNHFLMDYGKLDFFVAYTRPIDRPGRLGQTTKSL